MLRSVSTALLGGVVSALLVFAPAASAATEFGSTCKSDRAKIADKAGLQTSWATSGILLQTPAAGVVTMWKVNTGPAIDFSERLKVYRQKGAEWETVATSGGFVAGAKNTLNEFATRIPVPAGVSFGISSDKGSLPFCLGSSGDSVGFFTEDGEVGDSSPANFTESKAVLALAVVVEPDADGDGYGDETQDGCPANPMVQGSCVVVAPPGGSTPNPLTISLKAKLEGNVVAVQLTGSDKATASVSDALRGRPVAGPKPATIEPGQTSRAYLPLSAAVKQRLAKLPRRRHLKLVIEAKGQSAGGATATTSTELALRGRKKAHKHRRHRHG